MSVQMSLLALLAYGPGYGLQLRNDFEARTGSIWSLNVGQVYSTLSRLERDGLVEQHDTDSNEKLYSITDAGRARLRAWFSNPAEGGAPNRDELVLKLIMALGGGEVDPRDVLQAERKAAVKSLQEHTRLKRDADESDLGWLFLIDSLIFQTEARVRWLDACEERLKRGTSRRKGRTAARETEEVSR
jgi:DNA-binding PadR family transcriptional regulator